MADQVTGFELVDGPFDGAYADSARGAAPALWIVPSPGNGHRFELESFLAPVVGGEEYVRTGRTRLGRRVYRHADSQRPVDREAREAVAR